MHFFRYSKYNMKVVLKNRLKQLPYGEREVHEDHRRHMARAVEEQSR